jgi:hypothetical protein
MIRQVFILFALVAVALATRKRNLTFYVQFIKLTIKINLQQSVKILRAELLEELEPTLQTSHGKFH